VLAQTYGILGMGVAEDRRQAWVRVARRFLADWGDRDVYAFRAPARIALNPHCEHQGAWVPYGTHRREIICLAAARTDDIVTLTNLDPSHTSPMSFGLHTEVAAACGAWRRGWVDYIENAGVARRREALADPKERLHGRTGSINFVKAAALRLMMEAGAPPKGANLVIEGDIPVGVGQSSSSALVVVAALALNRLWSIGLDSRRLASTCGEAEWYVGTRGGAGDHAAMLLGSSEGLVGMRFVPPVAVHETRPMRLPPGYQILIANSGQRAIKNKEERRLFNAGIFAYRFALLYLRDALSAHGRDLGLPPMQDEVRFLADVSVEHFPLHVIYRLLLAVPEPVSPFELAARYPDSFEQGALACFGTADCGELPDSIPVRGAALYGLGRVDRGLAMHGLCARGDDAAMAEFGRLMYITHDGDRVSRYRAQDGCSLPWFENRESVSDDRMARLARIALDGHRDPSLDAVQLRRQSGYYGASTSELDRMVDVVTPLPEVLGAGLMGAGGGGCILILAREGEEATAAVTAALEQGYYQPLGKPVDVETWLPAPRAGELRIASSARTVESLPQDVQQDYGAVPARRGTTTE
jgi:galactokinase